MFLGASLLSFGSFLSLSSLPGIRVSFSLSEDLSYGYLLSDVPSLSAGLALNPDLPLDLALALLIALA
jgi:hypothetical protein